MRITNKKCSIERCGSSMSEYVEWKREKDVVGGRGNTSNSGGC